MRVIKKILAISLLLALTACNAQIKDAKTETVKIYGNCEMCKATIEKAANRKKVAQVEWDKNTKLAILTFDATKTNTNDILKRIALAGYDSDQFLAPDATYAQLPECCQYDRIKKSKSINEDKMLAIAEHNHAEMAKQQTEVPTQGNQLKTVFHDYFALKDALVASDGVLASSKAKDLQQAINSVEMAKLSSAEHASWMKVMKNLAIDTKHIEETKDINMQRNYFMSLSENIYIILKASKPETPMYYQHCPMANKGKGANWLSEEDEIKNPYYGSQMLSCGKTIETIK